MSDLPKPSAAVGLCSFPVPMQLHEADCMAWRVCTRKHDLQRMVALTSFRCSRTRLIRVTATCTQRHTG